MVRKGAESLVYRKCTQPHGAALGKHVLSVCPVEVSSFLFQTRKVKEVRRAVNLVVELLGVPEGELVLHRGFVPYAHEVVVPRPLRRHHEEAEESKGTLTFYTNYF